MKKYLKILMVFVFATTLIASPIKSIPESQVHFEKMTSLFLKGDFEGMDKIEGNDNGEYDSSLGLILKAGLETYSDKVTYKILEVNEDDNRSTIKLIGKGPDLSKDFENIFYKAENILSEYPMDDSHVTDEYISKVFKKLYKEIIDKNNFSYIEQELEISLYKEKDKWKIEDDHNYDLFAQIILANIFGTFQ